MAIVYRSERKRIVSNQVEIVQWLLNILLKASEIKAIKYSNQDLIAKAFKKVYMTPTASEKQDMEENKENSEFEY